MQSAFMSDTAAPAALSCSPSQVPAESSRQRLQRVVQQVMESIAPVWPLQDYIAVNPYQGLTRAGFMEAQARLQAVSDGELLMPLDYYRAQYRAGEFTPEDVDAAIDELAADGTPGVESLSGAVLRALLEGSEDLSRAQRAVVADGDTGGPRFRNFTLAERIDQQQGSQWNQAIVEEISKHCSTYYDRGQAFWPHPWKSLSLYAAWRAAMKHDRGLEVSGLSGVRRLVCALPAQPTQALALLVEQLQIHESEWEPFLLCEAFSISGWLAWARYQARSDPPHPELHRDAVTILVMRLSYEAALCARFGVPSGPWRLPEPPLWPLAELHRYVLLRSTEIAYRQRLLASLAAGRSQPARGEEVASARKRSQWVFCIDVRSERVRRHLEAADAGIETWGFAGFFGIPLERLAWGASHGVPQLPALLTPQLRVSETLRGGDPGEEARARRKRVAIRQGRKAWKEFQTSAASCFGFVESAGLLSAGALLARTFAWGTSRPPDADGLGPKAVERLGPRREDLVDQGFCLDQQVDLAAALLTNLGLVRDFAPLVVLCGHASQCENNPLQAALDCGACCGHSGAFNARLAAQLLNCPDVRGGLKSRGLHIPDAVHFLAALHQTTTDALEFLDLDLVPDAHRSGVAELAELSQTAMGAARTERARELGSGTDDLWRRGRDWSEVRPEWGLAGNAAFIAAPRSWTAAVDLQGRVFLHSYDHARDTDLRVLEQILTAPVIVAHWISMQYYASTVSPHRFGSGSKTIHNVVGQFGVFNGNGGDLRTGLPWQSLRTGDVYQHQPLRLLVIAAAPRTAIDHVLDRQASIRELVAGDWLQLLAAEGQRLFRCAPTRQWVEIESGAPGATGRCSGDAGLNFRSHGVHFSANLGGQGISLRRVEPPSNGSGREK